MEALELFRVMQMEGVKPNSATIPYLLPACGNITALMHGKATHCFSLRNVFFYDIYVSRALLDMYAKCGRIYLSRRCFYIMTTRNRVSWNALLGGYAMHGKTKEALNVFQLMQKSGQEPNFISFTSVLSAFYHSGLTEEGRSYFDSMSRDYETEPKMEHYSCTERMESEGFKKNPCCSWIKIKNKVHMLLAGDKSHPQKLEITKKLTEVRLEMQKSGYLTHTDFVLQDVEEHDEEMLCDHNEKLVVALGLVNTSPGFPLQSSPKS
ncbi:Pentatricopeptide repeat-containing protein At1g20230 [Linum perenne]